MVQFALILAVFAVVLLVSATTVWVAVLRRNPDLHVWPSVTRCRICEKRVFVWQRQEFRPYLVNVENPDRLPETALAGVTASGIVHRRCKGSPRVTVTFRRRSA